MRKLIVSFALILFVGFTVVGYAQNSWDRFEQQQREWQQIAQQPMQYDNTQIKPPELPTAYEPNGQQRFNRELRDYNQQQQQQQIYNQNVNTYNNNLYRQKRDH